jgi:hypothetical protein
LWEESAATNENAWRASGEDVKRAGEPIYALPDRVVYGYFDVLARYIVESSDWEKVSRVPPGRALA